MGEKKSYKSAFTMAEMLLCLGLISAIAAILIPTLGNVKPDKSEAMFKKAYQMTERIVYELVNDPVLYPDEDGVHGFDNVGVVYYNGEPFGGKYMAKPDGFDDDATNPEYEDYIGSQADQKSKFCQLFAKKLNTDSNLNCTTNAEFSSPSFKTSDGIEWIMPITNFTNQDNDNLAWKKIQIDVNGGKGPNELDSEGDNALCTGNVDRFTIYVRTDGLMGVKGACAREYLNSLTMIQKKYSGEGIDPAAGTQNNIVGDVEDDGTAHEPKGGVADSDKTLDQTGTGSFDPESNE